MKNPSEPGLFTWRETVGLAILFAGIFVAVIDNFIVIVAGPDIRLDLHATTEQVAFVISGYLVAFAVGVITGGRLGDRFGRRRMFIVGFAAFTLASGLCGAVSTPDSLIIARIVQGLSASLLMPQVLAIIRVSCVEPRQRATAFAWLGVVIGAGGVLGQVFGGLILGGNVLGLMWRPIFLINVPVGLVATCLSPFFLPESRSDRSLNLDVVGSFLAAAGCGLLLYPLITGREDNWPVWDAGIVIAAVIVLVVFVLQQRAKSLRGASPLVDTSLFRERSFSAGVAIVLLFYSTPSSLFLSLTYLIQGGFGDPPIDAALDFLPMAVGFAVTSYFTAKLLRFGARRMLMAGCVIIVASLISIAVLCSFGLHQGVPELFPSLVAIGVGQGLFMTPITNVVISAAHERSAGSAAGILTMMQRTGNALGIAVFEIPFFREIAMARAAGASEQAAYVAAFGVVCAWFAALLVVVTAVLRFLPADKPARALEPASNGTRNPIPLVSAATASLQRLQPGQDAGTSA